MAQTASRPGPRASRVGDAARAVLRTGTAALVLTMLAPARAIPAGDSIATDAATAARLDAHRQTLEQLASVQADVITRTHGPDGHTVGRVVLRGPLAYYRVAEVDDAGEHVVQESFVTAAEQWTINFTAGVATRVDMERVRAEAPHVAVPNAAADTLDVFRGVPPGSVRYLGPVLRKEQTLDRFHVSATTGDGPPGELRIWVAPGDGLPRRLELRAPAGRLLLERDFVNVKVNAPIPDALFVPSVPADMPVHDLTEEYLTHSPAP